MSSFIFRPAIKSMAAGSFGLLALNIIFLQSFNMPELSAEDSPGTPVIYDSLRPDVVLFPFEEAVIASTVDGNVTGYNYRPGEKFEKGATIASIDIRNYSELYAKADASCREAEKNSMFLKTLYESNEKLAKKGMFSELELARNKLDMEVSVIRVQSAAADKKLAALKVEGCRIKAPYSGRLESIQVRENEFVKAGQPMLTIINDSQLLAVTNLTDSMIMKIRKGGTLKFRIRQMDIVCEGKVFEISAKIDHRSRTFEVKMLIDNQNGKLTAGMSGVMESQTVPDGNIKLQSLNDSKIQ